MAKSGVESDGISNENDILEVFTVYPDRCSACNRVKWGCLACPAEEADKGSKGSGMISCDSRKAEVFNTRRVEVGLLNETTPRTVSPRRKVVLTSVRTATISPSLAMS